MTTRLIIESFYLIPITAFAYWTYTSLFFCHGCKYTTAISTSKNPFLRDYSHSHTVIRKRIKRLQAQNKGDTIGPLLWTEWVESKNTKRNNIKSLGAVKNQCMRSIFGKLPIHQHHSDKWFCQDDNYAIVLRQQN